MFGPEFYSEAGWNQHNEAEQNTLEAPDQTHVKFSNGLKNKIKAIYVL